MATIREAAQPSLLTAAAIRVLQNLSENPKPKDAATSSSQQQLPSHPRQQSSPQATPEQVTTSPSSESGPDAGPQLGRAASASEASDSSIQPGFTETVQTSSGSLQQRSAEGVQLAAQEMQPPERRAAQDPEQALGGGSGGGSGSGGSARQSRDAATSSYGSAAAFLGFRRVSTWSCIGHTRSQDSMAHRMLCPLEKPQCMRYEAEITDLQQYVQKTLHTIHALSVCFHSPVQSGN